MKNIYSICYEILEYISTIIEEENKYSSKDVDCIIDLLIKNDTKYEELLKNVVLESEIVDIETAKIIMIFIIASKSYLLNYYNMQNNICYDESKDMIEILSSMSKKDILYIFFSKDYLANILTDNYLCYMDRSYIFKNLSMNYVMAQKNSILKINPLEIFDLSTRIPEKEFLDTEFIIQKVIDSYDYAIEKIKEEREEDDFEEDSDIILEYFKENIRNYCHNDVYKINKIISYIISNVYENDIIENADKIFTNYVNNEKLDEIINRFWQYNEFAIYLIEEFIKYNASLYESDLIEKRERFNKIGNKKILERTNPYYWDEELVYKLVKKSMKD